MISLKVLTFHYRNYTTTTSRLDSHLAGRLLVGVGIYLYFLTDFLPRYMGWEVTDYNSTLRGGGFIL